MRKFILVLLFLIIVVGSICLFANRGIPYNAELLICTKDMKFYIMNFKLDRICEIDVNRFLKSMSQDFVYIKQEENECLVKIVSNDGEIHNLTIQKYVWGNPVLVNETLYFIATETNDRYTNAYLYSYNEGKVNKITSLQVDSISDIIFDNSNLYFVEKTSPNKYYVTKYGLQNKQVTRLFEGRFPCWKEYKKTLFCSTGNYWEDLSVVEVDTFTKSIVVENIGIIGTPKYNISNNLLLFQWNDDKASGAGFSGATSLLDLGNLKIINVNQYRSNVKNNNKNIKLNSLLSNSMYYDWVHGETRETGDGSLS